MDSEINSLTEQIIGAAIDVHRELVVVELKALDELQTVHEAQVLTYPKFTKCRVGLLFNFRSTVLTKHGLQRLAL